MTRAELSWVCRHDAPVPSGWRWLLADLIDYHYRGCVLGRTPLQRAYRGALERLLGPVWRRLTGESV